MMRIWSENPVGLRPVCRPEGAYHRCGLIEQAQRRIPVQYAKRMVVAGCIGSSTYIPLKVNQAGVILVTRPSLLYPLTRWSDCWRRNRQQGADFNTTQPDGNHPFT